MAESGPDLVFPFELMITIPLLITADSREIAEYESETPHEDVPDALVRSIQTSGGFLLVTIWKSHVHGVSYQIPKRFFWSRSKRNRALLAYYGEGHTWYENWPIDFGRSLKRNDGAVRALYSRPMDYITFTTTQFDEYRSAVKWNGIIIKS